MMANDWDLYEFLRRSAAGNLGGAAKDVLSNDDSFSFPNQTTAGSAAGGWGEKLQLFQSLHQRQLQILRDHNEANRAALQAQAERLRRKKQTTLEVRMKVEMAHKDSWSWRKYGQKPIKGSPYPRSYYRCSSSKACAARKQVELSQDNPEEYIVSYFGNHTHDRPAARRSTAGKNSTPPCPASPTAASYPAPTSTPSIVVSLEEENQQNDAHASIAEDEEQDYHADDDVILIPNNQIAEELFTAMHGFNTSPSTSGCLN